ncbi:hypothetical protein [Actinoplanes sp. NBRC 103695]|uniref:hypothetical protein n=1 Tax=Actinoplanes sp. NBRC 103695 TaxID=3032202 RepID=UPI0024A125C6|nr:hypothetical protein [Actinoplanes sp. NBRC 103695]GLY96153.1 hypothetical protein Acsp02_34080 [Actinoplanes sp. NBRC 103695]
MPQLSYAHDVHQIDGDLDKILDLVMAVAKNPAARDCPQSIFDAARPDCTGPAPGVRVRASSGLLHESLRI